jgi:hypothetical protein
MLAQAHPHREELVSYVDHLLLAPVRARLSINRELRQKYGALNQDFDCQKGEIFFGNLSPEEFAALPLKTKRLGGPAYCVRLFSEKAELAKDMSRVFRQTYEQLYQDKESKSVFVHTYELDILGIEY